MDIEPMGIPNSLMESERTFRLSDEDRSLILGLRGTMQELIKEIRELRDEPDEEWMQR